MSTDLAFVTSADAREGLGHLYRCLSVAEAADRRGLSSRFHLEGDLAARRALARERPRAEVAGWGEPASTVRDARCLLVDTRRDVAAILAAARRAGAPTIVLDRVDCLDAATRTVIPALHADLPPGTPALHGAAWCLLAPEVRTHVATRWPDGRHGTLLTVGGADPLGLTERLYDLLASLPQAGAVTVVAGPAMDAARAERLAARGATVLRAPTRGELVRRLAGARAVITGFGTTAYDAGALGTPVAWLSHRAEDDAAARRLEAAGVGAFAGAGHAFDAAAVTARLAETVLDPVWCGGSAPRAREALAEADGAARLAALAAELAEAA